MYKKQLSVCRSDASSNANWLIPWIPGVATFHNTAYIFDRINLSDFDVVLVLYEMFIMGWPLEA